MSAAVVISNGLNRDRRSHVPGPGGYWMSGRYTLATTNLDDTDDKVILDKFPARGRLMGGFVIVDDLDSATSLIWDLSTASALDGTVGTVLISNSTTGQAAGSDEIDVTARGTDVGGKYLMWHTNTASGTPVSGEVEWHLEIVEDNDLQTFSGSITSAQAGAPGEDLT